VTYYARPATQEVADLDGYRIELIDEGSPTPQHPDG